jgi:GGDEF domain-containing protein
MNKSIFLMLLDFQNFKKTINHVNTKVFIFYIYGDEIIKCHINSCRYYCSFLTKNVFNIILIKYH